MTQTLEQKCQNSLMSDIVMLYLPYFGEKVIHNHFSDIRNWKETKNNSKFIQDTYKLEAMAHIYRYATLVQLGVLIYDKF